MLLEDSTVLLELPFDITITEPDCTLMKITQLGQLKNMVITIGRSNKEVISDEESNGEVEESDNVEEVSQEIPSYLDDFGLM